MSQTEEILAPRVPENSRLQGSGSLRQFAYERVEELLNAGRLKPGEIVSQRELVALTGATLGSVREAVPRLEAEGLLVTVPKRGLMVPSLDVTFVREAYEVRKMMECAAVPHMIGTLSDQAIADWISLHKTLQDELKQQGRDVSEVLLDRLQKEDWNMHSAFITTMSNNLMNNIYRVNAIKIRMAVQSRLQVTVENAQRVLSEHLDILNPLAARDHTQTLQAVERHIDNSLTLALGGKLGTPQ